MATTESERTKDDTSSASSEEGKTVQPDIVESTEQRTDTGVASPEKDRTVPSSETEGTVWLRYAPKKSRGIEDSSET